MANFTLRAIVLSLLGIMLSAAGVGAETLLMPKRDALRSTAMIVWGVTTQPNGAATTYTFNFGDGTPNVTATVTDRSYINVSHVFPAAGTFTVTLTVVNGATTEVATTEVRVVDPAAIGGAGSTTGAVGPGSHKVYRDVRINMAIQDGLRYLWVTQANRASNFPNGTTVNWGLRQWTAFAITAFENHGYRLPSDPLVAPTGIYEKYLVQKGLNFIVGGLSAVQIANQPASSAPLQPINRNPCVGIGIEPSPCIGFNDPSNQPGYTIGIAMMPLAASSALNRTNGAIGPVQAQGKTYREILQRLANTLSHGQIDSNTPSRGGWAYGMNSAPLDGSVMGWAILGLLDAQAATIVVPDWVSTELAYGITGAWNSNGSFDYNADGLPGSHIYSGMEKAGIALQGMFMHGEVGSARANTTAGYISARWNTAGRVAPDNASWNCGSNNNKSCSYSMFNNFKGLKLQGIATLPGVPRAAGPGIIPANDWHADYEDWFVNNQQIPAVNNGGYWNMTFSNFGNDTNANVAIAELILSGVALVLPDEEKFATVGLSPATATAVEGNSHTLTAKAESTEGAAVAGATVNFEIISGPNAGLTHTAVTNAAGQATFTYPDAGPIPSYGTDRIRASIGTLQSNIAEMIWTPFNRPPVANPNAYDVNEDGTLNGNVVTDAPADTDPDNDELDASVESNVSHGTLTLLPSGAFEYTPDANYCGPDSFSYSVNDGMYDSDVAIVDINVICVNDPPVADDANATTTEDTAVSGQVSSSDVDGPSATYALGGGASNGAAVVNADGTFTYTPNANHCGSDSFTFTVSDGTASDTATVSVTINCVNDAPVASDSAASTSEDTPLPGTVSSTDVDGPGAAYTVATGPSHGTLTLNPDGTYVYTPALNYNGPDSFTFTVSDGAGGSDTGQVDITVAPVNDVPFCEAAGPSIGTLWAPNHQLYDVDVLGVTDPVEGSAITITITSIFQDEPTNSQGDGNTPVDGYGVGTNRARVRAERAGKGDGRVYHINFTGTDAQGGTCTGTVKVDVPHDQGPGGAAVDGGPLYSSTGS
jgi:VCBS repeat-containing protein